MRLKDKVAVVTGSGKGIGAQTALMFAREGAKVIIADIDRASMDEICRQIEGFGGTARGVYADVRNRESMKALAEKTCEVFGIPDVLVNNAGYPMFGYAVDDEEAEERYEAIMDTNVRGYWYAARFIVPFMKEKGSGSIINISSVRGQGGLANETAYCMAKGAVNMFTRSLAVELAPRNIRVNSISPGAIQVKLGHWVLSRYGEERFKEYTDRFRDIHLMGMTHNQPLRRLGKPEDIAYAAVYLASEESKFVTGSDIVVDGGLTSLLPEPGALDMKSLSELYERSAEMNEWFAALE